MPEAPYSFRRHRRMDLQPQPPAIPLHPSSSSALPATSQSANASPHQKAKHHSEELAAEAAAEPVVPVRASVRVKLRRTASANKQPASSSALSGKQLPNGHAGRPHHPPDSTTPPAEDEAAAAYRGGDDDGQAQAAVPGSRMQSSSGAHSALHLQSQHHAWQSEGELQQEQQLGEVNSARAVPGQAAAGAVSGHSKSLQQSEPDLQEAASQDAFGSETENVQREHAAVSGDAAEADVLTDMAELNEAEQAAGQSHVTGAPSNHAQQGDRHAGMDSPQSDIGQPPPFRELSMTESNAAGDAPVRGSMPHDYQVHDGVPSTQACQTGTSDAGLHDRPDTQGQSSRPAVSEEAADTADDKEKPPSSSTEMASPQRPLHQPVVHDGSRSVDQLPSQTNGSHVTNDRAESQLHVLPEDKATTRESLELPDEPEPSE